MCCAVTLILDSIKFLLHTLINELFIEAAVSVPVQCAVSSRLPPLYVTTLERLLSGSISRHLQR